MERPFEVRRTRQFDRWLRRLKDSAGRRAILVRLARLLNNHWGDASDVGDGVFELRVFSGPGYRVYGTWQSRKVVLLLCGGDKGSQKRDIAKAKRMARRLSEGGAHGEGQDGGVPR